MTLVSRDNTHIHVFENNPSLRVGESLFLTVVPLQPFLSMTDIQDGQQHVEVRT